MRTVGVRSAARRTPGHTLVGLVLAAALVLACAPAAPGAAGAPAQPAATAAPARGAAAPTASAGTSAAGAAWQAEWERTLAAGKQEGKVVVFGPPGQAYRDALTAFGKAYPEIAIELTGGGGNEFTPRLFAERRGDQYLWDIFVSGSSTGYTQLIPNGALDPLPPTFIRPEVTDDSKWMKGFDDGWADNAQQYIYMFSAVNNWTAYVNRQVVPESELTTLDQILTDPRFRGKIAMHDPRGAGAGSRMLGTLLYTKGEAAVRHLLTDQQVALTLDGRQLTEWLVRGRYPIALAISPDQFKQLEDQGISLDHIKPLTGDDPGLYGLNAGFGAVMLINRAPHPNAARVFINWLLSPEGQTIFAEKSTYNSRRTDVPVVAPDRAVDPRLDLVNLAKEKDNHWRERAQELAKESLK